MWYTDVRNQNQHWGKLLSTGCGCAAICIDTGLEDRVIVAGSFGVYCGTTCRGNAVKNAHKTPCHVLGTLSFQIGFCMLMYGLRHL